MRSREEIEKDVTRCCNSVEDLFLEVLLDIRCQCEKLLQLLEPSELTKASHTCHPNPGICGICGMDNRPTQHCPSPVEHDPATGFPRITGVHPDIIGGVH